MTASLVSKESKQHLQQLRRDISSVSESDLRYIGLVQEILDGVLPKDRTPCPDFNHIEVTIHTVREMRKKFFRYSFGMEDGEPADDIKNMMKDSCVLSTIDNRIALISHTPIWDRFKIIVEQEPNNVGRVVTVTKRRKDTAGDDNTRAFYGIILCQYLQKMDWVDITRMLCRFEHSNGRQGWGVVLLRKSDHRPIGMYLTIHELLDFLAYRNHGSTSAMGERLQQISRRLKLPLCVSPPQPVELLRESYSSHGLWADPPCPNMLNVDILSALIRRLEV